MKDVGSGLWEHEVDLKVFGANLGGTMNIANTDSGLFIHSPTKMSDEVKNAMPGIGQPSHIIAPNLFHHMFVNQYLQEYPEASFYTIPELAKRRPDLPNPIMIENDQTYPWSDVVDHFVFHGGKWFKEVIFYHKSSKTLILTDFAFNFRDTENAIVNFMLKITGSLNCFGQTYLEKFLIRDRKALRAAYDRILEWDFERISVAHGDQIESNGRQVFIDGMAREFR